MWVKLQNPEIQEPEEYLLPLKSIQIKGKLEGGLAILDVDLTYLNQDQKYPLDCSYEFPIDENTVIGNLVAKLDDKEVITQIKEIQKANEIYEDAVAGGKVAVMASRTRQNA